MAEGLFPLWLSWRRCQAAPRCHSPDSPGKERGAGGCALPYLSGLVSQGGRPGSQDHVWTPGSVLWTSLNLSPWPTFSGRDITGHEGDKTERWGMQWNWKTRGWACHKSTLHGPRKVQHGILGELCGQGRQERQFRSVADKGVRAKCMLFPHHPPPLNCCCRSVAKSCLALCNPMDCGPPGSSVQGILQARIPEWVAIYFSRGSS